MDYIINPSPDWEHRKKIELAIKENGGYCCCALEKTEDTKCMCKNFREAPVGTTCHCGLYIKTED